MSRHGKRRLSFRFNPYEIALSGYSGSGKTTLMEKLISRLSKDHKVAYAKSDCHKFQMDKEGKDTDRAAKAGAENILINDKQRQVSLKNNLSECSDLSFSLIDTDFAIVEGWKKDDSLEKILVLDSNGKALEGLKSGEFTNVFAVVGTEAPNGLDIPYFDRDDIDGIESLILTKFQEKQKSVKLKGLVLTGGFSTRMQKDKCAIEYHGKSQAAYAAELLEEVCSEVYLSCREDQKLPEDVNGVERLHDRFVGMGPSGGILSAFEKDPEAAWLVIGCDLPFVDKEAISTLMSGRNPMRFATAFVDPENGFPEPLLAVYEPKSRIRFLQYMANMQNCPRKVLINSPCSLLSQEGNAWLDNINTPEEYENAIRRFADV